MHTCRFLTIHSVLSHITIRCNTLACLGDYLIRLLKWEVHSFIYLTMHVLCWFVNCKVSRTELINLINVDILGVSFIYFAYVATLFLL